MDGDKNREKKFVVEEAESVLVPRIDLDGLSESEVNSLGSEKLYLSKFKKIPAILSFFEKKKKGMNEDNGSVKKKKSKKRIFFKIAIIALVIFIPLLIQGFFVFRVYQKGILLKTFADKLHNSASSGDLEVIKKEADDTKIALGSFNDSYRKIAWLKILPLAGKYIDDGEHAVNIGFYGLDLLATAIDVVSPYADIIGLSASSEKSQSGITTQDKLDFVIKTLPDLVPRADEIAEKMSLIIKEAEEINPNDYPTVFAGYEVREKIRSAYELADTASNMIKNAKPLLEVSPYLMGVDGERTYMVIFQNDKELRPTGGFITAYSIAKISKGKFDPTLSDDIYNLDEKYTSSVPAPEAIIKYIKGPYLLSNKLRLRDMNFSADFADSMDLFSKEIKKAGINNIDGIIAVDTQLLVNLLQVLGPIEVPGYGKFSNEIIAECNCPQVIYELESFADIEGPVVWSQDEPEKIIFAPANYDNRKKIIGPLMNSILSAALGQSNEKVAVLFEAVIKSMSEKHVLFYLNDEKAQKAVEDFGIGGVLKTSGGDYLHINDANLGGRKSNLYVTQEVLQEVEIDSDGNVSKKLTITYKNPEKYDGWLNSVLPNWVRIYVPQGSELISVEGLKDKEKPYEEYGMTVFAGYFELRPPGVAKISLKYKLPFKIEDKYSVYIQKQPGKDYSLYSFNIDGSESEVFLRTDKEFEFAVSGQK